MTKKNKDIFLYNGYPCLKIGKGNVAICRDMPELFTDDTIYGTVSAIKEFTKDVVIPQYAFENKTKTRYTVTEIAPSCFDGAGIIETLRLPKSISDMEWCFWDCENLREIHFDAKNANYCDVEGVVYSKDKRVLLIFPPAYLSEEYHVLPSTCEIGYRAFKRAKKLKTLYIPDSVHSIRLNAFYGCSALEHVYIEGHLRSFEGITKDTASKYIPDQTIFHYQGKEWKLDELKAEVAKSAESDKIR